MSETEQPKRKRLQFHLISLLILMFLASGLIFRHIYDYNSRMERAEHAQELAMETGDEIREIPRALKAKVLEDLELQIFTIDIPLLAAALCICEFLIRRREARKT